MMYSVNGWRSLLFRCVDFIVSDNKECPISGNKRIKSCLPKDLFLLLCNTQMSNVCVSISRHMERNAKDESTRSTCDLLEMMESFPLASPLNDVLQHMCDKTKTTWRSIYILDRRLEYKTEIQLVARRVGVVDPCSIPRIADGVKNLADYGYKPGEDVTIWLSESPVYRLSCLRINSPVGVMFS